MPAFVSNASPLIAFERLQRLDLLHAITDGIIIPPAVRLEVFATAGLPPWLHERSISQPSASQLLAPRLGPGEREAIVLALELRPSFVLLDDLPARRAAEELGLTVLGVVGLLLLAKERMLLPSVQPLLDQLIALDFRVSPRLYRAALVRAGE